MMKPELSMTNSLGFSAMTAPASQDAGFDPTVRTNQILGQSSLPLLPALEVEETLVVDDRFGQSPAQMVEWKLSRKLEETSLPVSHLQTRTLLRRR